MQIRLKRRRISPSGRLIIIRRPIQLACRLNTLNSTLMNWLAADGLDHAPSGRQCSHRALVCLGCRYRSFARSLVRLVIAARVGLLLANFVVRPVNSHSFALDIILALAKNKCKGKGSLARSPADFDEYPLGRAPNNCTEPSVWPPPDRARDTTERNGTAQVRRHRPGRQLAYGARVCSGRPRASLWLWLALPEKWRQSWLMIRRRLNWPPATRGARHAPPSPKANGKYFCLFVFVLASARQQQHQQRQQSRASGARQT